MGGKSFRKCEVCGVRRAGRNSDVFLARFPLDPDRCRIWVKRTGNEDLVYLPIIKLHENKYVCGNHFPPSEYNLNKTRLTRDAIPSLHLNAPLSDELLSSFPLIPECEKRENVLVDEDDDDDDAPSSKRSKSNDIDMCAPSTSKPTTPKTAVKIDPRTTTTAVKKDPKSTKTGVKKNPRTKKRVLKNIQDYAKICGFTNIEPTKKKPVKKLKPSHCMSPTPPNTSVDLGEIDTDLLENNVTDTLDNQDRKPEEKPILKNNTTTPQISKKSRLLRHNMSLQSIRNMQRSLKDVKLSPGINKLTLEALKEKASEMSVANKICALLFDEILLKKRLVYNEFSDKVEGFTDNGHREYRGRNQVADKALVFMLQGINVKYKQPVAFYFVQGATSSENLASIIKDVISSVEATGFTIINTVCDHGAMNCRALAVLKEWSYLPPTANYFLVDDQRKYIVFDVPQLFKSIRNNFYEAGSLKLDGKLGKWQHLRDAEAVNASMLYFHKISPLLMDPKQKLKMKVQYAAQTLSNTFAAVLKMIACKHEDTKYGKELGDTADVVRDLNNLFDSTNGPSSPTDVIKGRRENVSIKTNHIEVWNRFLKKLQAMYFKSNKVRCIECYIVTINSLKDIWSYCQEKGFKCLNLRSLNQDSLQNLFGIIRQSSPINQKPTCTHFMNALKSIHIGTNAPHSRGFNCEKDLNKILFVTPLNDPLSLNNGDMTSKEATCEEDNEFEDRIETDLIELENQPIVYLSGYAAYRLLKNNHCDRCSKLLKMEAVTDHPVYKFMQLREWWPDNMSLTYPTIQLCRTVEATVNSFQDNLHILHEENCGQILSALFSSNNINWWSCMEHRDGLSEQLYWLLGKILVRRQCHVLNADAVRTEEITASVVKMERCDMPTV